MSAPQPEPVSSEAPQQVKPLGFPAAPLDDVFIEAFHMSRPTADYSYYLRVVMNSAVLMLSDALALLVALMLGGLIRLAWVGQFLVADVGELLIPAWWIGSMVLRLTPGWGISAVEAVRRVVLLMFAVMAFLSFALFITHMTDVASRVALLSTCVMAAPLVGLLRSLIKGALIRLNRWGIPVVLYGWGTVLEHVAQVMQQENGLGYHAIGVFDDAAPRGSRIAGLPVLGSIQESTLQAPCAILAASEMLRGQVADLIEGSLAHYRHVIIIPDLLDTPSLWVRPREFIGVVGLEISNNLVKPTDRFLKRLFELVLVTLTAPAWLLLLAVFAFLIWVEDRGSPFYVQKRIGYKGQLIRTFKLRTMVLSAEEVLARHLANDPQLRAEWETHCKLKHDPRITWIGRFLRRTSLDELPQLFNVLAGTMAVVGPRPLPSYHEDKLPPRLREVRRRVRPGITGLWQVSGRSNTGNAGLERWDQYYVRNWSLWLDIVILVRTIRAVFRADGAY